MKCFPKYDYIFSMLRCSMKIIAIFLTLLWTQAQVHMRILWTREKFVHLKRHLYDPIQSDNCTVNCISVAPSASRFTVCTTETWFCDVNRDLTKTLVRWAKPEPYVIGQKCKTIVSAGMTLGRQVTVVC